MRYVFDLDGTICTQERDYAEARPNWPVIERMRQLRAEGHLIAVQTARGSGTGIEWRPVTEEQLERWGVPYDALYFGKPGAEAYVDDRAMHPASLLPAPHVMVVAEIGINHNGSLETALALIEAAKQAGADAVKFQKRSPRLAVPRSEWDRPRETPWGTMSYLAYKERIEFGEAEYDAIDRYCRERDIGWFASPWDVESVAFLERYDLPLLKVASASLTNRPLLEAVAATGRPVVLSTGMSTLAEVHEAAAILGSSLSIVCHCNSTYPCPPEDLNLRCIETLRREFPNCAVGYSGHETGLQTTVAAVALGASFIERHITLDRAMWGTDQSASVEPAGFARLVRDIRVIEAALGDGVKRVTAGELPALAKLRGVSA
jgi:N-acetylneuraminate synthase